MSEKTVHLSDLIFGSVFVGCFCLLFIWVGERLAFIPWIVLEFPPKLLSLIPDGTNDFVMMELVIILIIFLEIIWVCSWIIWFKIRRYGVIW